MAAAYNDTDLIEGDDLEEIEKKASMDCSFYMGEDVVPPRNRAGVEK